MSSSNGVMQLEVLDTDQAALEAPILQELVRQVRSQDPYGVYRSWSDALVLKPFIVAKEQKREISMEGPVDPVTLGRIVLFYRAIAGRIEQETGQLAQVAVDLNSEGFGWALVFCGRLLVARRTLRDTHRFGFPSFTKMAAEGEKIVQAGSQLAQTYPEVCKL